jgi:hypothetical protein
MAIHSDEFEWNMGHWLEEKASRALGETCSLAEWLREFGSQLPPDAREGLEARLWSQVHNLASVVSFAAGRLHGWDHDWEKALFFHGEEALNPFLGALRARDAVQVKPTAFPPSVAAALALLDEIESALKGAEPQRAVVRNSVSRLASVLQKGKLRDLAPLASRMLALMNQQTVDNAISWEEYTRSTCELLDTVRDRCTAIGEKFRWPKA